MPSSFDVLAAAAAPGGPSGLATLGLWAAILAIFYFIVFAPMRKQRKELQKTVEELKKGDKIITTGGVYAEIYAVHDSTVIAKIADNVRVRLAKSAIAGHQGSGGEGSQR